MDLTRSILPASMPKESDLRADVRLQSVHNAIEIKIARCFAFVGPHLPLDAISQSATLLETFSRAGRSVSMETAPLGALSVCLRSCDMVVDDALSSAGPAAINVGSAEDLSFFELAQAVVGSLDAATEIDAAKRPNPGAAVARYVPSVDRATAMLGLTQTVSLQEGIRRTANGMLGGDGVDGLTECFVV